MNTARLAVVVLILALAVGVTPVFAGGQPQPAATGEVVVQYWARQFEAYQTEWRDTWTQAYNEAKPGVTVEITYVPGSAWDEKVVAAQAVGEMPDVVHYSYNQVIPRARNGELLALNGLVPDGILEDLYPNVRAMVTTPDNKTWSYPELVEPSMVLYYHKDLLREAGLDPNRPPETWTQLLDYARRLTTADRYGLLIPFSAVELGWTMWGMRYGMTGHRLIDETWSKSMVVQNGQVAPGYLGIAQLWKSLYDANAVPRQALAGYVDIAPFAQKRAAMAFCGSWAIGSIKRDYPELLETVGVINAPTPNGNFNQATASLGGWTLAIDAKSKQPQQAADYITWLLGGDPKVMADFFVRSGFSKYAARKSVDDTLMRMPEAQADPWMGIIAERIVPYAVSETSYPFGINIAFGNALERVYLQGVNPAESFRTAHTEIESIIANERTAGKNPMARQ